MEGVAPSTPQAYVLSMGGSIYNGPLQVGLAYESNTNVRGANLSDYAYSLAGAWNFGCSVWAACTSASTTTPRRAT
jgi:hypothetical protein